VSNLVITIDMNKKCAECGKGGAQPSGICLGCTAKAIGGKRMKSQEGRAVALRMQSLLATKK
jgi:hypothetical protein